MNRSPLTREEELDLHRRLVEGDPVAPPLLAEAYLARLIVTLTNRNTRKVPPDAIEEAAGEALIRLIKKPQGFNPSRSKAPLPLFAYLIMAAQKDLQSILKKEERHWHGRKTLESVEQSSQAGKYLGTDEEPLRRLQLQEDAKKADREIISLVRQDLSAGEERVLALMLDGERKTVAFAQALGIDHLPKEEQKIEVKRVKGKLKKRIERGADGRAS